MNRSSTTCPASRQRVVDLYFLEHRAKLIDLAAFLDRVQRARPGTDGGQAQTTLSMPPAGDDFRMAAFRAALEILTDEKPEKARRVLDLLSDPTEAPIAAAGTKGATGAWPGGPNREDDCARVEDDGASR